MLLTGHRLVMLLLMKKGGPFKTSHELRGLVPAPTAAVAGCCWEPRRPTVEGCLKSTVVLWV